MLVVAESLADQLGVAQKERVYLHGYSCLSDTSIIERPDLARSRPMERAGRRALEAAGCGIEDVGFFDIYSCFPSAVLCAKRHLA